MPIDEPFKEQYGATYRTIVATSRGAPLAHPRKEYL